MKGINGDYTADEIKNEILELKLQNIHIIKVSKINFNKNKPDLYHFLIQLTSDSSPTELTKIKSIACQKAKWEPLKKKEIYQCRKCQRVGHSSINCPRKYRCVKCKDSHDPGQCKIDKETAEKKNLYCVNCESFGHPASYRGCPFLQFASNIKKIYDSATSTRLTEKPST